jgi:ABC-type nickel/cobalt efflux system permease component RcnA
MRRWSDLSGTVRGFIVVLAIVAVVFALQLERTIFALLLLARIAFLLAIAFFLYMIWRERRGEIGMWSRRSRVVFYGSALLMVANVALRIFYPTQGGMDVVAFLAVFVLGGWAMWRVWRAEHTYSY